MPDKFVPFAEPYTPNLVPQTKLDADPLEQIVQLERYLGEELDRISTAMLFVPVQAAYAALTVDPGPAPDQPLSNTPSLIVGWNAFQPEVPNRVTADFGIAESLVPLEGGVYLTMIQLACTVDTNTTYTITVAVNGILGSIFGLVNAGNQSNFITLTFFGLGELNAGDQVTVVGAAQGSGPGPWTFIIESGIFSMVRISELHGRDQGSAP